MTVLTVLPSSVQEAQANPCALEIEEEDGGDVNPNFNTDERECDFGYFEFDEE
jgi:hypothetical protein